MKIIEIFLSKIEYLILILILVLSSGFSYIILSNNISFVSSDYIIIEKPIVSNSISKEIRNIKFSNGEKLNNNRENSLLIKEKKELIENNIENYYSLKFEDKEFLLSSEEKSYEYGFITKEIKDNIMYLYSHNSYKYTENSGYFLYHKLKEGKIVIFNGKDKYKIVNVNELNFDKKTIDNIKIKKGVDIVYFTCTPLGGNIRKVFQLKKISNI